MELQFYGANCLRINTKKAQVVIDDNLADVGLKSVTKPGDLVLFTGPHGDPAVEAKLIIDQPGEYEASDISVKGVAARAHIDEAGQKSAVIYRLVAEDIRVVVLGHVYPELTEEQLEALGTVDVLCIPVGGNGYTLDPVGALKLIKTLEPKIVIPTHYADDKISYPVPQQDLDSALKALAMEPKDRVTKLKIKSTDLTDVAQLILLER